jgi:molybdopterin-guanine dinucleotide biosynthesis protein A
VVEFPAEPIDPFFNTNRPEDLAEAERLAAAVGGRGPRSRSA